MVNACTFIETSSIEPLLQSQTALTCLMRIKHIMSACVFFHLCSVFRCVRTYFATSFLLRHRFKVINLTTSPRRSTTLSTISSLCKQLIVCIQHRPQLAEQPVFPHLCVLLLKLDAIVHFVCLSDIAWQGVAITVLPCCRKCKARLKKASCPEPVRCDCLASGRSMKWADSECDARLLHVLYPMSGTRLRPQKYRLSDMLAPVSESLFLSRVPANALRSEAKKTKLPVRHRLKVRLFSPKAL